MKADAFNDAVAKFLNANGFATHIDQGHVAVDVPTDPAEAKRLATIKIPAATPCDRHIHESKVFFVAAGDPRAPMNSMSTEQFVENVVRRNAAVSDLEPGTPVTPVIPAPVDAAGDGEPGASHTPATDDDDEDVDDYEPASQAKQPAQNSGDAGKP